jgi:phage shock protein A
VSRARDQLALDNAALRQERQETATRHAAERAEWQAERAELRKEIDDLEDRLRETLAEVQALRIRHHMTGPPDTPKGGK